ncbi:MAG: hypothetical protein PWQ37_39 [Candidatus Petromonas sp.]|nr:hypothetical protein [Candidatus Petromonas sp.]
MQVFINGTKESEEKVRIELIHYQIDKLPTENINNGYLIDKESLPEIPQPKRGITYQLYYNPLEDILWYEERSRPLTQEEQQEIINEKLDLLMLNQFESEGIL